MARQFYVNGQMVYEDGVEEWYANGFILCEDAQAAGGFTAYPYGHQHLDRQFAGMAAAKLGGVLQ